MKIETKHVTIPVDVPEGFEAVAVRPPLPGEQFLGDDIVPCVADALPPVARGNRLIVRPVWKWPEWLTASYIAMDASGAWYGYDVRPVARMTGFAMAGTDGTCVPLRLTTFQPPPSALALYWKECVFKNPNN